MPNSNMGLPQTFDPGSIQYVGTAGGLGPKVPMLHGVPGEITGSPGGPLTISVNAGNPGLTQGYGTYTIDPKSGQYTLSNFVAPQKSDAGSLFDHLIQAGSMTGLAAAGGLAAGEAAGLTGDATSLMGDSNSLLGSSLADTTAPDIAGFSPSAIAPSAPLDTSGMASLGDASGGGSLLGPGGGSSLGGGAIGGGGGTPGGMTFDNSGLVNDIANSASQSSAPSIASDASNIAQQGAAGIANDASPSFLSKLGSILQQKLPGQLLQFGNQQQTNGNNRLAALLMQRPEMAQGNLPGGGVTSPYGVV